MADYNKKKVDELTALCKERGLAHTGKKADLVKRLEDNDASSTKPAATEDEIDWDVDEPATETAKDATSEPAANAIAAGGKGPVDNPLAVPNQEPAFDPAQPDSLKETAANENAASGDAEKKPETDYGTGLADRTLDEEIEKRKARARKFGMSEDSDEIKMLERAKRFGTTEHLALLNKALPEKQDRKRGSDSEHDGGIRKRGRGGRGGRGRFGRGRRQLEGAPAPVSSDMSWMSEADREKAERRKARFATNSTT